MMMVKIEFEANWNRTRDCVAQWLWNCLTICIVIAR